MAVNPNDPTTFTAGNYVSPEQQAAMRNYANLLSQTATTMPVKSGWQGLGQVANAVMGGYMSHLADVQQGQMAQGAAEHLTPYEQQIMGGVSGPGGTTLASNSQENYQPSFNAPQGPISQMLAQVATQQGINPKTVHSVVGQESSMDPMAKGDYDKNGKPTSFGLFQLHYAPDGKALGDQFTRQYGIDLRDPKQLASSVYLQSQFALQNAKQLGWDPWLTTRLKLGIGKWDGIQTASSNPNFAPQTPMQRDTAPTGIGGFPATHMQIPNGAQPAGGPPTATAPMPAQAGSAPVGPPPTPQTVAQNGPPVMAGAQNPNMVSALRGGGLSPQYIASVMADPRIDPAIKNQIASFVTPTTQEGAFGDIYLRSPYQMMQGVPPQLVGNFGKTFPTKYPGGLEFQSFGTRGPGGQPQVTPLLPNMGMNGGGGPSQTSTGGPSQTSTGGPSQTESTGRNPYTPDPHYVRSGGPYNQIPNTGNPTDYINWGETGQSNQASDVKAKEAAQVERTAAQGSLKSINNQQTNLNTMKEALEQAKGNKVDAIFGPAGERTNEVLGVARQIFGPDIIPDSAVKGLNAYGLFKKAASNYVTQSLGQLQGFGGRVLAAEFNQAIKGSPNEEMTAEQLERVIDSVNNIMQYNRQYNIAKENWIQKNERTDDFDRQWQNGINGKGSTIPEAKIFKLSNFPIDSKPVKSKNGKTGWKYPDTSERGWSYYDDPPQGQ